MQNDFTPPQPDAQQQLECLHIMRFGSHHVTLRLHRPEVHNALNAQLIKELLSVVRQMPAEVRTVLIEGAGPSFCAGADLRSWQPAATDGHSTQPPVEANRLQELFAALQDAPQAIVAQVHGAAFGGGAGLVAAVDVAIASDSARFGFTEVRLGLVPAVIAPYVLRAIGAAQARYLFMTAMPLNAAQALQAGLVQQVAPDGQLHKQVWDVLQAIWRGGPQAVATCKQLLHKLADAPADSQARLCEQTLTHVRASPEAQHGISAFFARKKPHWIQSL